MDVTIGVLGPVGLWTGERRQSIGSLKEQSVLTILALEVGRPVAKDDIIDRLWDERPPVRARGNLNSYVSRLRGHLGRATDGQITITLLADSYRLDIDRDDIDLWRFRRLRSQAESVGRSGDHDHAARLRREAEGLGRGEALAGLPGHWMQLTREGIQEERRSLTLDRIDDDIRAGHHVRVLSELRQLAAHYPTDERITAQLMEVLYRGDRRADALDLFHQFRSLLAGTLGVEPGRRVKEMYQRILECDAELSITPQYRASRQPGQPCNLPSVMTSFVGRADELAILKRGAGGSVHVITGMPGVGKTALALQEAHRERKRFPDAQIFLDLAGHDPMHDPLTPSQALNSLLRSLDIPAPEIPTSLKGRVELWRAETESRRAIVVLDDAADDEQVRPLLPGAAGCRVMVTARSKLHDLPNAVQIRLGEMSTDDAGELFATIAGCADQERISEAVLLCGQLPLAIQLAASRVRNGEALSSLVAELSRNAADLGSSSDGVRAAFDLSYRKLMPSQQEVARLLSWHPHDRFSSESAAQLAGGSEADLGAALTTLLERHLVEQTDETSYRFHSLVRLYLRGRSAAEDSQQDIRKALKRLLRYYLTFAYRVDCISHADRRRPEICVSQVPDWKDPEVAARQWFNREGSGMLAMVQYSMRHGWNEQGAHLAYLISKSLEERGAWEESSSALEMALRSYQELGDSPGVIRTALEMSFLCFLRGDDSAALRNANMALAIARPIDDHHGSADALDRIGLVHWSRGRYRVALAHFQEALRLYVKTQNQAGEASTLSHIGISYWHLGRYDDAHASIESALRLSRDIGNYRVMAIALNNLGDIQQSRGYHRDAIRSYHESRKIFNGILGEQNHAILFSNIGNVHRYKNKYDQALEFYRKALAVYREAGDRRNIADTYNNIGIAYRKSERYNEALVHHERARDIATELKSPYEVTRALLGIANTHRDAGKYPLALQKYQEALMFARKLGDLYQEACVHEGIADVTFLTKGKENARIYWLQALDIYQRLGVQEAQRVAIRLQSPDDMT